MLETKKLAREFSVVIEQDEDGYFVASVPALHGCHTQAKSLDVLMKRIREAIELCLESTNPWRMDIRLSAVPRIVEIQINDDSIIAQLADGRSISVPSVWFLRLSDATPEQRSNFEIIGNGDWSRPPCPGRPPMTLHQRLWRWRASTDGPGSQLTFAAKDTPND